MSTHSFVSALLRFSNKFGIPSHIYIYNARSFLKGCDVISEVFSCSQFLKHFQTYNIKHVTIPVYSPWVGSTWERLIRVVKNCIQKSVGRAKIEYFDMLTLLCDVENAVNSRPLTYRTSESDLEVITPNSFIYLNSNTNLFLRIEGENPTLSEPPSQSLLLQSLSNRNHLLKHFHELWNNAKNSYEHIFENKIDVDDIVLIRHPQKSRPLWLLGRVVEVFKGDANKIRSANVKRDGSIQKLFNQPFVPFRTSTAHKRIYFTMQQCR